MVQNFLVLYSTSRLERMNRCASLSWVEKLLSCPTLWVYISGLLRRKNYLEIHGKVTLAHRFPFSIRVVL